MKFTLSWLKEHVPTTLTASEVGQRLTMAGLELEYLTYLGQGLNNVRTGFLESVAPHPNADKLTLCRVRLGETTRTIVCGARNHRAGDMVAVALPGAQLPNGLTIKIGKIRGETSEGMLCSLKELGLADESDGILILPASTPEDLPIAAALGRDDFLLEVNVTPNRGDCLGVRGIARELAAVTETKLLPLNSNVEEDDAVNQSVQVHIEDPTGCPRYAGRVITGVTIAPSPEWLKNRLESVGLRSINNVVDVTNLVMMELGQPLHAFDLDTLHTPIVVRRAREGETITTLDGVIRTLTPEMTLIADQTRALALAGIMGGEESGVSDKTTTLFLESAWFEPVRIARTGRKLEILSDSRYRFERGTDPNGIKTALDRATRLILDVAGGRAGTATVSEAGSLKAPPPIPLRPERINRIGGISLSEAEMTALLTRLGCTVNKGKQGLTCTPPSFRPDITQEEDLLEEVVRVFGYDRVPSRLPMVSLHQNPVFDSTTASQARAVLTGMGYLEVVNFAFVSRWLQEVFDPERPTLALLNPLSEDQAVMRTTLAVTLMEAARRNISRGNRQLRLTEVGRVFHAESAGAVTEPEHVAGLLSGPVVERTWHGPARDGEFFDLKGDVETLLATLGAAGCTFRAGGPAFLHPGRKAQVLTADGQTLGWCGELHPEVTERLDLPQSVLLFELAAQPLARAMTTAPAATPPSRFPPVARDFAFVVNQETPAEELMAALRKSKLVRQVSLFDLYQGDKVAPGMKSLAINVTFQADDRTLGEEEIQKLMNGVITTMARQFSATLRDS